MVAFCARLSISDCEGGKEDKWYMAKISQLRYSFALRSLMHSSSSGNVTLLRCLVLLFPDDIDTDWDDFFSDLELPISTE